MTEIIRNRTMRPSTRKETSVNYRVHVQAVESSDTLIVNINHEKKSFKKTYHFSGKDIAHKNNISFRANDFVTHIDIVWSRVKPIKELL
jgi:hypothetical protein